MNFELRKQRFMEAFGTFLGIDNISGEEDRREFNKELEVFVDRIIEEDRTFFNEMKNELSSLLTQNGNDQGG